MTYFMFETALLHDNVLIQFQYELKQLNNNQFLSSGKNNFWHFKRFVIFIRTDFTASVYLGLKINVFKNQTFKNIKDLVTWYFINFEEDLKIKDFEGLSNGSDRA